MNTKPFVAIRCMTYNHAPYITDAMNGFCMQKTNFPYVAIIIDDASTDGGPEIIKDYLNNHFDMPNARRWETEDAFFIEVQHQENINCWFAVIFLKYNFYQRRKSKEYLYDEWEKHVQYSALCEGDDFWTAQNKLQKQIDFLKSNPEYSMCFHSTKIQNETNNLPSTCCDCILDKDYTANEIMTRWIVSTNSMVFRREIYDYKMVGTERILNEDTTIKLRCASCGKIRGFSDTMSTYRINNGGVTQDPTKQTARLKKFPDHYVFLRDNFPIVSRKIINNYLGSSYFTRAQIVDRFYQPIFWSDIVRALYYNPHAVFSTIRRYIKQKL